MMDAVIASNITMRLGSKPYRDTTKSIKAGHPIPRHIFGLSSGERSHIHDLLDEHGYSPFMVGTGQQQLKQAPKSDQ